MTAETRIPPINLQRIDIDNLEDVEDIPEAVRFSILLSGVPSETWLQEFSYAYALMNHPIKPPVEIIGDRLWIAYLPRYARELQSYLDFVQSVARRASDEEANSDSMNQHDEGQKARFRDVLKGVRI